MGKNFYLEIRYQEGKTTVSDKLQSCDKVTLGVTNSDALLLLSWYALLKKSTERAHYLSTFNSAIADREVLSVRFTK